MGNMDSRGRRSGFGIECFGQTIDSGISYAGQWKKNRWHGSGVCFVPPSGPTDTKTEWFVGRFKDGQLDGEAVQYDLYERDLVHCEGIWRRNEIVMTQKMSRRLIMEARKRAGQAMAIAREIETRKEYETRALENANVKESRVLSVWDPSKQQTVHVLVSAVNQYAGTITVRRSLPQGRRDRSSGSKDSESVESIPIDVFLSVWLQMPTPSHLIPMCRLVLPPTASLSRQFGIDRLNELRSSQVDALKQTMETQRQQQVEAFQDIARSRLHSEPTTAPPPPPNSTQPAQMNDLDCLTDEELRTMTTIDGWSDRELRALARIRRQQQHRRQERHRRMRQVRRSHHEDENEEDYEGKYDRVPREDDMLYYTSPDASVENMDDVFLYSGGTPRYTNRNPFEDMEEWNAPQLSSSSSSPQLSSSSSPSPSPSLPPPPAPPTTTASRRSNTTSRRTTAAAGKMDIVEETSSAKLKRLQRFRRERDSKEIKTCSICLDNITSRKDTRMLICAHTFHNTCVSEWLERSNVCPLCRTEQC